MKNIKYILSFAALIIVDFFANYGFLKLKWKYVDAFNVNLEGEGSIYAVSIAQCIITAVIIILGLYLIDKIVKNCGKEKWIVGVLLLILLAVPCMSIIVKSINFQMIAYINIQLTPYILSICVMLIWFAVEMIKVSKDK